MNYHRERFRKLTFRVLALRRSDKINITIEFMFLGINMFWARLRLIVARAALNITLEGIDKKTTKHSEEYFFHQRCEKTSTNLEIASRF